MLSHRFQTIFVHVPKAAGQSIATVFLDQHGLNWQQRGELLMRPNRDRRLGPRHLAHLYAREYVGCGHVSPETFARYFKFAVVRNPYERTLSEYRFRIRDSAVPLVDFLNGLPDDDWFDSARHLAPQTEFLLGSDGRLLVDRVIRYENLEREVPDVFRRIFGSSLSLPRVNESSGPRAGFSGEAEQIIYRRFESDFDYFGYPRQK
jgi:hypothetical protein